MSARIDQGRQVAAGLVAIAKNQLLGVDDAEKIELMCRLHFDTVRRGLCAEEGRMFIAFNILTAALIGKEIKSIGLESMAIAAYNAVFDANLRNDKLLALTTKEWDAVRTLINRYFAFLPKVQIGLVSRCAHNAALIYEQDKPKKDAA